MSSCRATNANLDLLALAASEGGARIDAKDAGKRVEIADLAHAGLVACIRATSTYSQWVATDAGMTRLHARPARPLSDWVEYFSFAALLCACYMAVAP